MSARNRPPLAERLGSKLADAVLRNHLPEAQELARRIVAKEAAERRRLEDARRGRA